MRASSASLVFGLLSLATSLTGACRTTPETPLEPVAPPVQYVPDRTAADPPPPAPRRTPPTQLPPSAPPPRASTPPPAPPRAAAVSTDPPEISRSVGAPGEVIIFWPRVIPRTETPEMRAVAFGLQQRLRAIAMRTFPGKRVDVRPEPERVCPRAGCTATTIGVVLANDVQGCAAIAFVSAPGQSPQELVPWGGEVRLKTSKVPFRDPPEAQVTLDDYVPCAKLLDDEKLAQREADVVAALIRNFH